MFPFPSWDKHNAADFLPHITHAHARATYHTRTARAHTLTRTRSHMHTLTLTHGLSHTLTPIFWFLFFLHLKAVYFSSFFLHSAQLVNFDN